MKIEKLTNVKDFDGKIFFGFPDVYPDKNGRDCTVIIFDDDENGPIFVEASYSGGRFIHGDDDITKKVRYWTSEYIDSPNSVGFDVLDGDIMNIIEGPVPRFPDPVGFKPGFVSRNYCPLPNISRGKSHFMQMLKTRSYIESQNIPVKRTKNQRKGRR